MKPTLRISFLVVSFFLIASPLKAEERPGELKVHEWGTFTTLHAPSGSSLAWYQPNPRGVSELPSFVYPRIRVSRKGSMMTTARMETPVLYFYTDTKQSVDLSVRYPDGTITETFPRTDGIPALGTWKGLELIPPSLAGEGIHLPIDSKLPRSHYYEARAVPDAAYVRRAQQPDEAEKFVFYRGAGSFASGLGVRMDFEESGISVSNINESHSIGHAWVVQSSADAVRWKKIPALPAWKGNSATQTPVPFISLGAGTSRSASITDLKASIVAALTEVGLTPAEAAAMVATWGEQWFEEPGQRVFSIVPEAVIDKILPLEISPKPSQMVRVFVHRAEVLAHKTLQNLEMSMAPETDPDQASKLITEAQLGRFIHGALGFVAKEVGWRTELEYRNRGLQAVPVGEKAAEISSANSNSPPG